WNSSKLIGLNHLDLRIGSFDSWKRTCRTERFARESDITTIAWRVTQALQIICGNLSDLKKYGATTVVRVCEITYDKTPLEKDGITVVWLPATVWLTTVLCSLVFSRRKSQDWPFDDGAPPPSKVVEDWLSLLKRRFIEEPGCCVAVHCVAGLGRAPVLVAVALIESGMKYEDAIQFIRQKRRGAINSKQLTYLEKYRPKQRLRYKHPHIFKNKCCIM
uniref:Protein tyrosine phosphatase 4A3a n=1 Tax=Cyprinus carpio carpio TaxID=630221 RepID=A0A8C1EC01_CYPCA